MAFTGTFCVKFILVHSLFMIVTQYINVTLIAINTKQLKGSRTRLVTSLNSFSERALVLARRELEGLEVLWSWGDE